MGKEQPRRQRQHPAGTRPHGTGIQIKFKPQGHKNYCYETLPWNTSPANIAKAGRLRRDIVDAIKHDIFRYADFFPNSPKATESQNGSFYHYAQAWLDSPSNDWKPQSRYKFKGILNRVWVPGLHEKPIRSITQSQIETALITATAEFKADFKKEPSQSTYNDWLLCLRGVFEAAEKDGAIQRATNPALGFRNKKRPRTEPDPFDDDEREAIIADIYKHDGPMWGAWFELGFFTGMRFPSEPAGLTWQKIDFRKKEMRVDQIQTRHNLQKTTKTGVARTVFLNSRAIHALKTVRKITGFQGNRIFLLDNGNHITQGKPHTKRFRASLKRLGIRERDPYNMRHTYASWGLSNGLQPAFMANQLGHTPDEFFKTYAKWTGAAQNALQMELMERAIKQNGAKTGHKKTSTR